MNRDEPVGAKEQYRMDIAAIPTLTREQGQALAERARGGDRQARVALVESLMPFVYAVASRYARISGLDILDVAQQGNLAVLAQLEAGLARGHTYAYLKTTARGAILHYCLEYASLIRTPRTRGVRPHRVMSLDAPAYKESSVTLADLLEA